MGKKNDSPPAEAGQAQAWLVQEQANRRGRIRLGGPTTPERARETAQRVRQTRPHGSSDYVTVQPATRRR